METKEPYVYRTEPTTRYLAHDGATVYHEHRAGMRPVCGATLGEGWRVVKQQPAGKLCAACQRARRRQERMAKKLESKGTEQ